MPDDVVQIQRSESRIAEAAKALAASDAAEAAPVADVAEPATAPDATAADAPASAPEPVSPPAETAPSADADQLYTERMADIARRQRDLDMRHHQLKSYERELASLKTLSERVKTDPIATLRDLGVDFYKLVEDNIGSGIVERPAESKQVDPRIDELAKTVKELQADARKEASARQERSAKSDIRTMVESNPDRLKLVDKYGDEALDLVFNRSLQEWKQTGRWDPAMAALEVEEALRDQAKKDLERVRASGLFDDMFAGASPKAAAPKPAKAPETQMGSELTRESPVAADSRRLSREERLAKAAKFAELNDLKI